MMALVFIYGAMPTASTALAEEKPSVVSMNLCTDQLVLLLADPDQILSLSYLAHDERTSVYYDQALGYPTNRGLAEEVYILKPDLIVTGIYSNWVASSMLEKLGLPVMRFDPAYQLDDIRTNILEMGRLLGQTDRAEALVAAFDKRLAAIKINEKVKPRAALYEANGYTSGSLSLAHHIIEAAGFHNIGGEFGTSYGARLSPEALLMKVPDIIILSRPGRGYARAEEVTRHPALDHLKEAAPIEAVTTKDWVCDTPRILDAIEALANLRPSFDQQP